MKSYVHRELGFAIIIEANLIVQFIEHKELQQSITNYSGQGLFISKNTGIKI